MRSSSPAVDRASDRLEPFGPPAWATSSSPPPPPPTSRAGPLMTLRAETPCPTRSDETTATSWALPSSFGPEHDDPRLDLVPGLKRQQPQILARGAGHGRHHDGAVTHPLRVGGQAAGGLGPVPIFEGAEPLFLVLRPLQKRGQRRADVAEPGLKGGGGTLQLSPEPTMW